jgi:hypothetical protein
MPGQLGHEHDVVAGALELGDARVAQHMRRQLELGGEASIPDETTPRPAGPLTPEGLRVARLDRGLSEAALHAAVRMSEWRRLLNQPELPPEISTVLASVLFD